MDDATDRDPFDTMTVSAKCVSCGNTETTEVIKDDLLRFHQGEYIQRAFPEATPEQRELIMQSGRGGFFIGSECGCWKQTMGDE